MGKAIDWLVLAGNYDLEKFALKTERFFVRYPPQPLFKHTNALSLSSR